MLPGQSENQYQKMIRSAVQGVFAASLHPRTAVQIIIQVCSQISCYFDHVQPRMQMFAIQSSAVEKG